MGLFDFLKRKSAVSRQPVSQQASLADRNFYLLEVLQRMLAEMGHRVDRHPQYLTLTVNQALEISTAIMDSPDYHPGILHLMILTTHPEYFPEGIEEHIAGIGATLQDKVASVTGNYIHTTFLPIMESFSDRHNPGLDLSVTADGKPVLWHPELGNLTLQGRWSDAPAAEQLFDLVRDKLESKLAFKKLHWLKMYISRQADGTIIGECNFDNEPWDEGLAAIKAYAESWAQKGDFLGMKQFIMFRRCDG